MNWVVYAHYAEGFIFDVYESGKIYRICAPSVPVKERKRGRNCEEGKEEKEIVAISTSEFKKSNRSLKRWGCFPRAYFWNSLERADLRKFNREVAFPGQQKVEMREETLADQFHRG